MNRPIRIIITGTTGMVGAGVLQVCLLQPDVEKILVINRKPCGVTHSKLTEIIHPDFFDLSTIKDKLIGYDACFFCLGISSVGINKEEYYKTTYTLALQFANTLKETSENLTFCYISGAGTDEKSSQNWARVKAKTENDLMSIFPGNVYGVRPGFIKPIKGQLHVHSFYKYINWLFPIGRKMFPGGFCTIVELALCMIHLAEHKNHEKLLSGKDIIAVAKEGS